MINVLDHGVIANGTTDNLLAMQKIVDNAAPGDVIDLPSSIIKLGTVSGDTLDLSNKPGLRFRGNGGHPFNDTPPIGAVLCTGAANQTLIKVDGGLELIHRGPTFNDVNFWDDHGDGTAYHCKTVNHWGFHRPNFSGQWRCGIVIDAVVTTEISGDNSYSWLFEPTFSLTKPGNISIDIIEGGCIKTYGGNWDAFEPAFGVRLQRAQEVQMAFGKFNYPGNHIYTEGGNNKFWGLSHESWGTDFSVVVKRPVNALPYQATNNKFMMPTFTAHPFGVGRFIHLGPGGWQNDLLHPTLVGGYTNAAQNIYSGVKNENKANICFPPMPLPKVTGRKASMALATKQMLAACVLAGICEDKTT